MFITVVPKDQPKWSEVLYKRSVLDDSCPEKLTIEIHQTQSQGRGRTLQQSEQCDNGKCH